MERLELSHRSANGLRCVVVASVIILVAVVVVRSDWLVSAQETNLDAGDLQGRWRLEAVGDQRVDTPRPIYFEINGDTISGYDGCNRFGGVLGASRGIRAGQRGCVEGNVRLPLDLSDPVGQLRSARLAGDILILRYPDGVETATLRRDVRD